MSIYYEQIFPLKHRPQIPSATWLEFMCVLP